MKILIPTFLLAVIFSSVGFTQTALAGKVTDSDTGEELIAANVAIFRDGVIITGVATDFEGNYSINMDPGVYDVEISYIGYATNRIENVLVQANRNNRLDITLGGGYDFTDTRQSWRYLKNELIPFESPDSDGKELVVEVLNNLPACSGY